MLCTISHYFTSTGIICHAMYWYSLSKLRCNEYLHRWALHHHLSETTHHHASAHHSVRYATLNARLKAKGRHTCYTVIHDTVSVHVFVCIVSSSFIWLSHLSRPFLRNSHNIPPTFQISFFPFSFTHCLVTHLSASDLFSTKALYRSIYLLTFTQLS